MSSKLPHRLDLPSIIRSYATKRLFEYHRYSKYHMRIIDSDLTVFDCWLTGKYWIKETNYYKSSKNIIERQGETGILPPNSQLESFLDKIFFATEI